MAAPPQQRPPGGHQAPESERDRRLAEAVAAILGAGLTIAAATAAIRKALTPLGLAPSAVAAAYHLARRIPTLYQAPVRLRPTAVSIVRQQALMYRARYIVNAARRLDAAVRARPRGQSQQAALNRALNRERTYLRAHVAMQRRRHQAAQAVDRAAAVHGDRLGWLTVIDDRTDPECRAAAFHDFLVSDPPNIGFPGTVHAGCRCKPTAPWGTQLLP